MGAEKHRGTPSLREFATRLLAGEGAAAKRAGVNAPAFHTCEKLRPPLGKMMGVAGFRSLFSRALALASADVPALCALHVKADGSLEGIEELEGKLSADEMALAEVILVERLLELLVTFVGPALTLQLIRNAWPGTKFNDLDFKTGDLP